MPNSPEEQLMIELLNQARLDPLGEAQRLGFSAAEIDAMDLPSGSAAALAGISQLQSAADSHSSWMLATDTFSHSGANGSSAGDRMGAAGYNFSGGYAWGENIGYRASSGTIDPVQATYNLHRGLFESDGHRANMLNSAFAEVGVGEQIGDYLGYSSVMVTQNFATTANRVFLTGVVYDDNDNDNFYSVGEGVGGVRFAIGGQSASTQSAGGYSMEFDGQGWQSVWITGAGISMRVEVRFGADNVKLDLVDHNTVQSSASMVLYSGVSNGILLGLDALDLSGNSGANQLIGNAGNNSISGLAGNDILTGAGGDDTLTGGHGDDTLTGGHGNDVILGGSGSDTAVLNVLSGSVLVTQTANGVAITSNDGTDLYADVEYFQFTNGVLSLNALLDSADPSNVNAPTPNMQVFGGGGNDTLDGHGGDDTLSGGAGFDTLSGGAGFDTLSGGAGFDTLSGGADNDTLNGNAGNDVMNGDTGNDSLAGGIGFDTMNGGEGDDVMFGADGYDAMFGGAGNDTMSGNNGFDVLHGGDGNDLLTGGLGLDTMYGDAGNDTLNGQAGFDVLEGGTGNDLLNGNAGRDTLRGGEGEDTLNGGINHDELHGDAGNDLLNGNNGIDTLYGGLGDDTLFGNAGSDSLHGGEGNDVLNGGLAQDTFYFDLGADTIQDFSNNFDTIALDMDLFDAGFDFSGGPSAVASFFTVVNGNLVGDFGGGDTLQINGLTNFNALLDDMIFY